MSLRVREIVASEFDGLRSWAEACRLSMGIDNEYHGAGTRSQWRCKKSGHVFRRLYIATSNSPSLRAIPRAHYAVNGRAASGLARKKKATNWVVPSGKNEAFLEVFPLT